jgi:hypothetical protein
MYYVRQRLQMRNGRVRRGSKTEEDAGSAVVRVVVPEPPIPNAAGARRGDGSPAVANGKLYPGRASVDRERPDRFQPGRVAALHQPVQPFCRRRRRPPIAEKMVLLAPPRPARRHGSPARRLRGPLVIYAEALSTTSGEIENHVIDVIRTNAAGCGKTMSQITNT